LTLGGEGGCGGGFGLGPSAPQKPEWLRAAHIHWGNKRSLCKEGRGGGRKRERKGARERLDGPTYYL